MYTRILVPLDGSPRAERSVPVAALLARATNGSIVLVRALGAGGTYGPADPTQRALTLLEEERREATDYLTRISGLPVLSGIPTEIGVFTGPAAISILDAIIGYKADSIIITSHGRTGLPRWALGSVAEHVARHAKVPVLVLREQGSSPAEPVPGRAYVPRVLVALDGSTLSEAVLDPAVEMAKILGASDSGALHLVLVVSPFEVAEAGMREREAVYTANEYLAGIAAQIRIQHPEVTVSWRIPLDGDAAAGLLRVAGNTDNANDTSGFDTCSMIAMATHGRSGLARWMFGSVTERMLHATAMPMLIVRPRTMEEEEVAEEVKVGTAATEPVGADVPTLSALF